MELHAREDMHVDLVFLVVHRVYHLLVAGVQVALVADGAHQVEFLYRCGEAEIETQVDIERAGRHAEPEMAVLVVVGGHLVVAILGPADIAVELRQCVVGQLGHPLHVYGVACRHSFLLPPEPVSAPPHADDQHQRREDEYHQQGYHQYDEKNVCLCHFRL